MRTVSSISITVCTYRIRRIRHSPLFPRQNDLTVDRKLSSARGGGHKTLPLAILPRRRNGQFQRSTMVWMPARPSDTTTVQDVEFWLCSRRNRTLSMVRVARVVRDRMAGDGSTLCGYDAGFGKRWILGCLSVESIVIRTVSVCISHCTSWTSFVT